MCRQMVMAWAISMSNIGNPKDSGSRWTMAIPIRLKLLLATIVVGLAATLIAVSGLSRMQSLNDRMNRIVDVSAAKSKLASLMNQDLVTVTRAEKNMILAKSEVEMERYVSTIDESLDELDANAEKLRDLVTDETRGLLDEFKRTWNQWKLNHRQLRSLTRLNSDVKAKNLSVGEAQKQIDTMEQSLVKASSEITDDVVTAGLIADIRLSMLQLQRIEKNLILASNAKAADEFVIQVQPLRSEVSNALETLATRDGINEEMVSAAKDAFEQYGRHADAIQALMGESGNYRLFHLAYGVGGPLADESEKLLESIVVSSEKEINELQSSSKRSYENARNGLILISVVGILGSLMFSFLLGDRFARNLSKLATYAREVHDAQDLSKPIPHAGNDEVGQVGEALDGMRETVYLQTQQLAALNNALKDKSHEMEQFVYTVSHDLKSPLVSCKGMLGLMREDLADEEYDEVIDSINRMDVATSQLSQIIDDLLELSRIGRKPLDVTDVDVAELVAEVIDTMKERTDEAGIEVVVENQLPHVRADQSDLRRVFDNLISNAIKYAGDVQNPRIEIGSAESSHHQRYYVRDNGPGIEPDYQEKVFGLFQRLETKKEGTGLGLASVRKIARMHGGRAWVESRPNQGATFWIEFPKCEAIQRL
ncbi:ATP-binding protein [Planctomycetes bacterium TBK1r]